MTAYFELLTGHVRGETSLADIVTVGIEGNPAEPSSRSLSTRA